MQALPSQLHLAVAERSGEQGKLALDIKAGLVPARMVIVAHRRVPTSGGGRLADWGQGAAVEEGSAPAVWMVQPRGAFRGSQPRIPLILIPTDR